MMHLLKRHPLPIAAHFDEVLVLTYAFPREILAPLLSPGLELDTYGDLGFLAVAMVQTRALRPAFLPEMFGRDFFLAGYRIFVRLTTARGQTLRGLKILRSDTDQPGMVTWGNLLTHYRYRLADVSSRKRNGSLEITITTPDGEADLDVVADLSNMPGPLPAGTPFPDLETARKFSGPLPHTFDYEPESHSIIVIRGMREDWKPQPVAVRILKNTFIQGAPFNAATPLLANAFYLSNVPYRWQRGWREPLPRA
jgi:hypothetical protein